MGRWSSGLRDCGTQPERLACLALLVAERVRVSLALAVGFLVD